MTKRGPKGTSMLHAAGPREAGGQPIGGFLLLDGGVLARLRGDRVGPGVDLGLGLYGLVQVGERYLDADALHVLREIRLAGALDEQRGLRGDAGEVIEIAHVLDERDLADERRAAQVLDP